jgi:hypothetical protein
MTTERNFGMDSFQSGHQDINAAASDGDERDPTDRRPDWVIFREQEERLQADVDEAEARHEQERSGESYGRRVWVAEAAADDDDVDY